MLFSLQFKTTLPYKDILDICKFFTVTVVNPRSFYNMLRSFVIGAPLKLRDSQLSKVLKVALTAIAVTKCERKWLLCFCTKNVNYELSIVDVREIIFKNF